MPTWRRTSSIFFRSIGQLDAVDDDAASLVWFQPVDAPDQRRLAGARWATDHDPLAARHRQVDVAQDVEISEPLVDALHLNVKHGRTSGHSS